MSRPDHDAARQAGFTLIEVLVALVVAGLFLVVLGRGFSTAWLASRIPGETAAAMSIARSVMAHDPAGEAAEPPLAGFTYRRSVGPVRIEARPSSLAPAPLGLEAATRAGGEAAPPAAAAGRKPRLTLRHMAVTVTSLSHRHLDFDTIRLIDEGSSGAAVP
jgi:prepilin-type N-terminal cleavage/methylation domain-containing protein